MAHGLLSELALLVAELGQTSQAGVMLLVSIAMTLLRELALLEGIPSSSAKFTRYGPTGNTECEKRVEGGGEE